eukprot:TRINITY_DN93159_c0_g1_i1.p1 TRINITY_DN93159_c0_g1~~TRINITY_DN93159_c0_g1_i1.p1  ORF type:complete len:216 (-),score=15.75 TRINITY_DN93159_c0_g1_i1:116-763(-)
MSPKCLECFCLTEFIRLGFANTLESNSVASHGIGDCINLMGHVPAGRKACVQHSKRRCMWRWWQRVFSISIVDAHDVREQHKCLKEYFSNPASGVRMLAIFLNWFDSIIFSAKMQTVKDAFLEPRLGHDALNMISGSNQDELMELRISHDALSMISSSSQPRHLLSPEHKHAHIWWLCKVSYGSMLCKRNLGEAPERPRSYYRYALFFPPVAGMS